eukprot:scaffold89822_cov32-Tisochrysis_lutea.AAC.1
MPLSGVANAQHCRPPVSLPSDTCNCPAHRGRLLEAASLPGPPPRAPHWSRPMPWHGKSPSLRSLGQHTSLGSRLYCVAWGAGSEVLCEP